MKYETIYNSEAIKTVLNDEELKKYPLIQKFYVFVLEENYLSMKKFTNDEGRIFYSIINDVDDNYNDYENFLSEDQIYSIQKNILNELKRNPKDRKIIYEDLKILMRQEAYYQIQDKMDFVDEEINVDSEIKKYVRQLDDEEIEKLISEVEEVTGKHIDREDENYLEDFYDLFVDYIDYIEISNDYESLIDNILNETYRNTLLYTTKEEDEVSYELNNKYMGKGLLRLLNDDCENDEREEIIKEMDKERCALRCLLEDNYGLTKEVLIDKDKTQKWKEEQGDFGKALFEELENTDFYSQQNILAFITQMPLGDLIILDLLKDEENNVNSDLDFSLIQQNQLKIEKTYGGIYDPFVGGGSIMGMKFENINIPLKGIRPIVYQLLNGKNYYEADEVFGFSSRVYEFSKVEVEIKHDVKNQINNEIASNNNEENKTLKI